jgi:hypothetical protein
MTIYKGSQKEGKVYKGGTEIGKIYKGSQLVYQSKKLIQLYVASYSEYTSGKYTYYGVSGLLGSWSTDGYVISCTYKHKYNPDSSIYKDSKIYLVSGTFGASGSKVGSSSSSHASYRKTIMINGLTCYIYEGDSGVGDPIIFVLPDSVVNNYTINNSDFIITPNVDRVVHPTSVTSNSFTYTTYYGTYTVTRESTDVLTFTKENGLI